MPVNTGDIVNGKYRVEHVLGEGGMGVVVAARHLDLEELYAIKIMKREALGSDAYAERRFIGEARAAARLKGAHVARVHDIGRLDTGELYMVMEHLEGTDLKKLVRKHGALPAQEAIRYVLQTCEAIAEAHALDIIHRDIKPHNLFLLEGRSSIKVLDFGISKQHTPGKSDFTGTNVMLGTLSTCRPSRWSRASRSTRGATSGRSASCSTSSSQAASHSPGRAFSKSSTASPEEHRRHRASCSRAFPLPSTPWWRAACNAIPRGASRARPSSRARSIRCPQHRAQDLAPAIATPTRAAVTASPMSSESRAASGSDAQLTKPELRISMPPASRVPVTEAQAHSTLRLTTGSAPTSSKDEPAHHAPRAGRWAIGLGALGFVALTIVVFTRGANPTSPASPSTQGSSLASVQPPGAPVRAIAASVDAQLPDEQPHQVSPNANAQPPSEVTHEPSSIAPAQLPSESSPSAALPPANKPSHKATPRGSSSKPSNHIHKDRSSVAAQSAPTPAPATGAPIEHPAPGVPSPDVSRTGPMTSCARKWGATFSIRVDVSGYSREQRERFINTSKICAGDADSTQLCCVRSQLTN